MKFPSLKNLAQTAFDTIKRFPLELLFALIGTIAAIAYIEIERLNITKETWCMRVIMTADLGLLLSLFATLYSESKKITGANKLLIKLIAAVIGCCFLFIINPFEHEADHIRFFLLSLALHLLVAFSGFIKSDHIQGFWQFNKTIFLRFLTGFLYSIVLFLGIAAAIGAMNFLFNFKFEWDTFAILWVCIAGMFNTIFFLAGVPGDIIVLDEDFTYPKGLKVFTQYVLIPLATVYVMILLAYEIKILIEWNLPKGLVSDLILSYAVFGILAILLVFPVREQAENKWIKTYARSFYFLMLPLIILLLLAVYTRISHYGITEYRYFLILLSLWLLFVTAYFLISRKQNIKLIPMSLCMLILLSIYGPQSAFSVSMYAQRNILINILKRNHAFIGDKLIPVDSNKISQKDGNRAVATLDYLVEHYDLTCLQPFFKKDLQLVSDSISKLKSVYSNGLPVSRYEFRNMKLEWIKKQLALSKFDDYHYKYAVDTTVGVENKYVYLVTAQKSDLKKVKGYDYVLGQSNTESDTTIFTADNIHIRNQKSGSYYSISLNNEVITFDSKRLMDTLFKNEEKLKPYKKNKKFSTETNYDLPAEMLSFTMQTKGYLITFKINSVRLGVKKKVVTEILYLNADYFIKVK